MIWKAQSQKGWIKSDSYLAESDSPWERCDHYTAQGERCCRGFGHDEEHETQEDALDAAAASRR